MPQTINTNIVSLNAQRNLNASQSSLSTSMQRLSSGLRVNSAKDDAAGLAIAERMSANVRGMNVAMRNANDAISMSQVAEGALGKIGDNLQRMRELAVQARNATNSTGDRVNLQKEFRQLQQEVERTIKGAKFNGKDLFTSTASTSLEFQVGSGTTNQDHITIENFALDGAASLATSASVAAASYAASAADAGVIQQLMVTIVTEYDGSMGGLGIGGTNAGAASVPSMAHIDASINAIDRALDLVNERRANFGAAQNRFEAVISNLQINVENQSAARGRIMDADFAVETSNMSRSQILQQAGTAMVAQANQLPQQVMQLLGR